LFDRYHYVGHDGPTFHRAVDILQEEDLRNTFLIINVWETHYPYFDGTDAADDPNLPRFPSWRARLARGLHGPQQYASFEVSEQQLEAMRLRQQRSVQLVDQTMESLLDILPRPAFVTVTADHGDCLGESGQFLHGEAYDPAVLRVPLIEGPVP
jgi:arylsulfatase A-like enzyme